ncbi:3-hydroxyacyl-CoA dehydrogenase NAD-binding domain-containing protein [Methylobacterium oryzae CBMB20]
MTERVAIVGAGLIGRAWAMIFARAGWDVRLFDAAAGRRRGRGAALRRGIADARGQRSLPRSGGSRGAHLRRRDPGRPPSTGPRSCRRTGPERLDVKRSLFAELDALAPAEAVIASSSSAIRCSLFTEGLPGRSRCLIGHPVNPPHLIPLVEISGAPWTDAAVLDRARATYEAIGQVPITVLKEIEGFILNRLQGALLAEAFRLAVGGLRHPAGSRQDRLGRARPALELHGAVRDHRAERARRHRGLLRALHRLLQEPRRRPGTADRVTRRPATEAILANWQAPADLPARMNRRDARLAALRAHKASQKD